MILSAHRSFGAAAAETRTLDAIRQTLTSALARVDRKLVRAKVVLESDRDWVASLLGNEDGSLFTREPAQEKLLSRGETVLASDLRRMSELSAIRCKLMQLLAILDGTSTGGDDRIPRSVRPDSIRGASSLEITQKEDQVPKEHGTWLYCALPLRIFQSGRSAG